jgi:hypothetical protein
MNENERFLQEALYLKISFCHSIFKLKMSSYHCLLVSLTIVYCVLPIDSVTAQSAPDIEWQKCLGGTLFEWASAIEQTNDGGYIVAGSTNSDDGDVSDNHGDYDIWVVKLNSTGVLQWQKCLGGTSDELAYSIQQTTDDGYIIAGWTYSNDGDVSGLHGYYHDY